MRDVVSTLIQCQFAVWVVSKPCSDTITRFAATHIRLF